jgi:asparagine synthase (glutamine-hydrolysing)
MSSLPLYQRLAEAAAEEGVRVLLTGEGVDELFCGYGSYSKVHGLTSLIDYYRHPQRDNLVRTLFGEDGIATARARFSAMYSTYADLRYIEREIRLVRLLLRSDACLMSVSIEGRVPFLHNRVPEMALAIPWQELVIGHGKTALRRAYRDALGVRAVARKTRFKASDAVLRRCLGKHDLPERILSAAIRVFGETAARRCLAALGSDEGFDADVCCLLISLTFLVENGSIDGYAA